LLLIYVFSFSSQLLGTAVREKEQHFAGKKKDKASVHWARAGAGVV